MVTDSELVFSFTLGWQETQVTYSIKKFKVDWLDNIKLRLKVKVLLTELNKKYNKNDTN